MELLSQASRILYDKEILDFKKKQQETAEENKILHTPHVQYENQEEWKTHVNLFKETIKQFIFNHKDDMAVEWIIVCGTETGYFIHFKKIYEEALYTLLKKQHRKWCEYKTKEVIESVRTGFAGLEGVITKGKHGTYPFTNWSDYDYKTYMWNMVEYHQGWEYKNSTLCRTSWLHDIPLINPIVK